MTNYDEYRKRNHSLRDRFGENGCQVSAVLSRCERAGEGRGKGDKRSEGASVIKLGTVRVAVPANPTRRGIKRAKPRVT